ncbi:MULTISPECIES: GNAT family N-acetyltransferase [Haloferax]|nr:MULTISPECIES: GNAT family N-acetyltransferase [Haloferax]
MGHLHQRDQRTDGYRVQQFSAENLDGFLSLHELTYGGEPTTELFDWRYNSPYLDEIPIFVALDDADTVVGATAFLPFRIAAGDTAALALQPANAMVHPEHRRNGLFSRTLTSAIDHYRESDAEFFFNFPTPPALPALTKLGWEDVGTMPTCFRLQHPVALLNGSVPDSITPVASRIATTVAKGHCRIRRGFADCDPSIDVERYDDVPVDLFVDLYEENVPERVHVVKDRAYVGWRFGNPTWDTVSYVARRDGRPVTGLVACTRQANGITVTVLMSVLPSTAVDRDTDALVAVLDAVVDDHRHVDVIRVSGYSLPDSILERFDFLSNHAFPLSRVTNKTHLVTRPIVDDAEDQWYLGGHNISGKDNWLIELADQDAPF